MSQKVLSILITAYNGASYHRETLQLLLIEKPYRSRLDIIVDNDSSRLKH